MFSVSALRVILSWQMLAFHNDLAAIPFCTVVSAYTRIVRISKELDMISVHALTDASLVSRV